MTRNNTAAESAKTQSAHAQTNADTYITERPRGQASANTAAARAQAGVLDLAIIGSGPAALTAALYAARAGLAVTVFERGNFGGALAEISHIANFPGFDGSGPELAQRISDQARAAGAHLEYGECSALEMVPENMFQLSIDGAPVLARSVLVATGSEPRRLDFEPAPPTSYCALCDGDLISGQNVAVVGGGNSAVQEALYLANLAQSVTIITRSTIKSDHTLRARLGSTPSLTVREHTPITPEALNSFDRIFVYIGKCPATSFLKSLAPVLGAPANDAAQSAAQPAITRPPAAQPAAQPAFPQGLTPVLDREGYIITVAGSYATSVPGLFAAGDVRSGAVRQAITAAGEGAAATTEVIAFLSH